MNEQEAFTLVSTELDKAQVDFASFNNYHEGWAVIKEEFDELWDEIKGEQRKPQLELEAKQVAAMAIRFLLDCC